MMYVIQVSFLGLWFSLFPMLQRAAELVEVDAALAEIERILEKP